MIALTEPLGTVLRQAAKMMVKGHEGACEKPNTHVKIGPIWQHERRHVVTYLAQEAEAASRQQLTIRKANPNLFRDRQIRGPHEFFAVCDRQVTVQHTEMVADTDLCHWLYVITFSIKASAGVMVRLGQRR